MTKKEQDKLIIFFSKFFVEKEVFINPSIKINKKDTGGYVFIEKKQIKGIVAIGNKYPLSDRDVSIKDTIALADFIDKIKVYGVILPISIDRKKMTYVAEGKNCELI